MMNFFKNLFRKLKLKCKSTCCKGNVEIEIDNEKLPRNLIS